MNVYTFRPARHKSGYNITLVGDDYAFETVDTRFQAEQAVRKRNLEQRQKRLDNIPIKASVLKRKKPSKPRTRVPFDFKVPQHFIDTMVFAKPYIRRGMLKEFYRLRASQLSCGVTTLINKMPKVRKPK